MLSVAQGFEAFLSRLTPTTTQMTAASRHRSSVTSSLEHRVGVKRFRETGSFHHGTGVRNYCDIDLLASLYDRPASSDTALNRVRDALRASFPYTNVYVSRPAVVVDFAGGLERWEVIPAYLRSRSDWEPYSYDIPAASSGWMISAPVEHLDYVNSVNEMPSIKGAAKRLARFAKAWKYYNNVPVSSFYLEMRAARYMASTSPYVAIYDVCYFLEDLQKSGLSAMNDPSNLTGRIAAYSSEAKAIEARSKLLTAATRARKALNASRSGDDATAFGYLDLLFNGNFPSRY